MKRSFKLTPYGLAITAGEFTSILQKPVPSTPLLIKEYKLIKEKNSKLSRMERDRVVKEIERLVSLGVLKEAEM